MLRTRPWLVLVAALLAVLGTFVTTQPAAAADGRPFTNPVKAQKGADPWLEYYNGNYYLINTISSYNYPDRYIRHYDFRARIEANVTNLADSQFRIVTGLAGTGTISLESTNYPGYYLRHKNFEVWVEKDDGTTAFDSDASFYQRSGLADPSGVSLESYNYPGRYIRHYNNLLYVQTPSTMLDKQDATYYLE